MNEKIETLKAHVREVSANPAFIHHRWFAKYHLEIVETIARELLTKYPEADPDTVIVMAWMHDYGKILDFDNQYTKTLSAGRDTLLELGFDGPFVDRVIGNIEMLDKKMELDLRQAPIEVKIVSSADAASHHVGPFMPLFWQENAGRPFEELMASQIRKTMKDWDRKMVLPEVRQAFEARHKFVLEQSGEMPEKYLAA